MATRSASRKTCTTGSRSTATRSQSDANVQLVNFHKRWEERILRHIDWLARQDGIDGRWLAIGRTHIESAFMSVNRSVFKPGRIKLPEDQDGDTLPSNQRPINGGPAHS